MNIGCGNDILESCHISEETNILEGTGETHLRYLMALLACKVFALEENFTRSNWINACDDVEDRSLTSAVRADECTDFTSVDMKIDLVKCGDSTELNCGVLEFKKFL
jgi:hypothetical protein